MATKKITETKSPAKKSAAKKTSAKKTEKPVDGNVGDTHEKIQLWKDGPYWATTNIGAEKPEDFGYYFWWGDTIGYKRVKNKWVATNGLSSNYSFEDTSAVFAIFYADDGIYCLEQEGWITLDSGVLVPEHDAAHVQWGGEWRMPTRQELDDLVKECDWTWTKVKGVQGYVVRGRGVYASSSIFLPCAGRSDGADLDSVGLSGYCWSSNPESDGNTYAWNLSFDSCDHDTCYGDCYFGRSVRPVQGSTK